VNHVARAKKFQRNALNFGRSAFALGNRDKQVAAPRHRDANRYMP
jgi:hypothetical protein